MSTGADAHEADDCRRIMMRGLPLRWRRSARESAKRSQGSADTGRESRLPRHGIAVEQRPSADDLLAGFNPWDQKGRTLTRDFAVFRQYVADGGAVPVDRDPNSSSRTSRRHRVQLLKNLQRPLVGVMGGHSLSRSSPAYADIAKLTSCLAHDGFLLGAWQP
jgi:hypothetical protein